MADETEVPNPATTNEHTDAGGGAEAKEMSAQDRLTDLVARATALYAVKDYSPAAELFSQATELQAQMNGEMAIENADLLYSYGKCLYFVAVRNSEVLGANSAGAKLSGRNNQSDVKPNKKRKLNGEAAQPEASSSRPTSQEEPAAPPTDKGTSDSNLPKGGTAANKEQNESPAPNKPYFNITGDENWDNSDEDNAEDADPNDDEHEEEEEDQDDFSLAFEVLDLSRVLLLRKLDALQQSALDSSQKGKYISSIDQAPSVREVKERLADVYDLQAEISLEGERYSNAVSDLKSSLALKEELYPFESNFVAECHYKLSLALEFGSKTQQRDADGNPLGEAHIDAGMRAEAVQAMETAIESCRRRIKKEELEVDLLEKGEKRDQAMKDVDEVREIVEEMQQRLDDLKADPVDVVHEATRQPELEAAGGLLKEILAGGKSKEEAKRMLEEASGSARDLSGLVKRKKDNNNNNKSGTATPESSTAAHPAAVNGSGSGSGTTLGKRKVAFADEVTGGDSNEAAESKRARVEDVEDSGL